MRNRSIYGTGRRFDVTCSPAKLPQVIDFAVRFFDHHDMLTRETCRVKPAYQISANGKYFAFTGGSMAPGGLSAPLGLPVHLPWEDLPFDYDPELIAQRVVEWAERAASDPKHGTLVIRARSPYSVLLDDPNDHGLSGDEDPILVFSPGIVDCLH